MSALPRRNASSGPSVVVSARAFGVVLPDDDDDDDNGLDDAFEKTSMFWTKLCRRRRGRRLGVVVVVETEDETGGTPKETMRRTILAFAFVLHALLLGLLLLRIGFGFFSTKHY